MADNQVKFKRGLSSEYTALETKDADDIYITTDDGKIYLGDKELGVDEIPQASKDTSGVMKLYAETGDNEDGTMTQKAITDAIGSGGGSMTPEQILEKLKTVDGTGSGLDADLLDGKHASDFFFKNSIELTDANDATSGTWLCSPSTLNIPENSYGTLLAFDCSGNPAYDSIIQWFIRSDGYIQYMRVRTNKDWFSWYNIADGGVANYLAARNHDGSLDPDWNARLQVDGSAFKLIAGNGTIWTSVNYADYANKSLAVESGYSSNASCLRNLASGTADANTTNCPNGAWYGKH